MGWYDNASNEEQEAFRRDMEQSELEARCERAAIKEYGVSIRTSNLREWLSASQLKKKLGRKPVTLENVEAAIDKILDEIDKKFKDVV